MIKRYLGTALLALLGVSASAQQLDPAAIEALMKQQGAAMANMDPAQLAAMAAKAEAMQKCMNNIDRSALDAMERDGRAMHAEVQGLCAAGQRDQAQQQAMAFAREAAASESYQQLAKCGAGMMEAMPALQAMAAPASLEALESSAIHVCDAN